MVRPIQTSPFSWWLVFQGHAALILSKFFPSFLLEQCMWCTLVEHLKTCNRILFIQIAWSVSESECATCTDLPFCRSHTLSPEHARHSDWWQHWQVAHFSISLTASRQTRCSCDSWIWMDDGKQQWKVSSHSVYKFINLYILSLNKTGGNETDWN